MTNPNGNAPAPGTPAPSTPAAGGAPAPSSAPAPAPSAPASSGGGGGSDAAYWRGEFEKSRDERQVLKEKLREYETQSESEKQAAQADLEQKLARQSEVEAELKGKLQERNRVDARRHFVDAILARVPEGQREDVDLRLAGLEQKGELSIPDDYPDDVTPDDLRKLATEAAAEQLTKLVDRYPGWFAGGSAGVGTPAGPGGGPMPEDWMALTPEQQRNMSDEDFAKHYGSQRKQKKRRTLMG